jgi:hypothetical protein
MFTKRCGKPSGKPQENRLESWLIFHISVNLYPRVTFSIKNDGLMEVNGFNGV